MEARSLLRSRAEILFAELLVEDADPSAERVRQICAAHPELTPELERLHARLTSMRALLPSWATPGAGSSAAEQPLPPDLGSFRCERLLGRGGMGEVWEARDLALERKVAVKLLRDAWLAGDKQIQRFQREAQAAGRVQHSGIVSVFQTGEWQGRHYIVQELVPGGRTLRDEIEDLRRLPELPASHARRVAERFAKLADALAAAHGAGVVHRDLKPQNVLLSPDGQPKVADFGLALLVDDASLSRTGEFMGTYFYASPEQVEGDGRAADERSDVFSLGATLYENLTLTRAFDGDSVREISRAVALSDPPAPHQLRGRVPLELSLVCMKALEKRPQERYASMAELRDDLTRFLAHEPIRARPPSPARRALKWSLRHPTLATALALSASASLALLALFLRSEQARASATRAQAATDEVNRSLLETSSALRVQSAVSEEVIDFLVGLFAKANPMVSGDRVPSIREVLDDAIARIERGEIEDPRVRARLLGCVGVVARALGDPARGKPLLQQALADWESLGAGEEPPAIEVRISLAMTLHALGETEEANARLAALVARIGEDAEFDARFGWTIWMSLGEARNAEGRFGEAEEAFDRAEELFRLHPQPPDALLRLKSDRADSAYVQHRTEEARVLLEEILAEHPDLVASANPTALHAVAMLGMILIEEGRLEEAEQHFLALGEEASRSLDADHPTALLYRTNLARVWEAMGRYADAEGLYREIASQLEQSLGPLNLGVLTNRNNVGTCLVFQGRIAEAEETIRDAWEKHRQVFGGDHHATLRVQHNLAHALGLLGRVEEALALQEGVVAGTPPDDPDSANRRSQLEGLRARMGARE